MSEESICKHCGNPKSSSSSGRLTQFISICSCDVVLNQSESQKLIDIQLCQTCGKRIGKGREGSITQFIFRADICDCENPQPINTRVEAVPHLLDSLEIEEIEEDELDLEEKDFPIERYKPISLVGRGSTGNVYLARDRILNKLVAVKTLNTLDKEQIISFQEEARATSKLKHPNIIEILDFGVVESGKPYMVFEYFKGETLESIIQSHKQISWEQAKPVIIQIAGALAYSHNHGIFHRDIKPTNIMVNDFGTNDLSVKLIDFGIAKIDGTATQYQGQTLAGTPSYMSPDIASGYEYTESSEIYSLGCVIFEALTGQVPFGGETPLEVLSNHAKKDPPPISTLASSKIPESIEDLVQNCLKKPPDQRFKRMNDLLSEIESISHKDSTRKAKSTSKSKVIPLFVSLSLAILLIAGFTVFQKSQNTERAPTASRKSYRKAAKIKYKREGEYFGFGFKEWSRPNKIGGKIDDEDLKIIAEDVLAKNIDSLDLAKESITGSGLKYLKDLPLRYLSIEGNPLKESYLNELDIPNLRHLVLNETKISDTGINHLKSMKGLKSLGLVDCKSISNSQMCSLITDSNLEILVINGTKINDQFLKSASQSKLQELHVSKTNITNQGMKYLLSMPDLRGLNLSDCKNVTIDSVKEICLKNPNILYLSIGYIKMDGEDLSFLNHCKELRHLYLMGLPVTDKDIETISNLKAVNILHIARAKISDKSLPRIARMNLIYLALYNCPGVTAKGLEKFKRQLSPNCAAYITEVKNKSTSEASDDDFANFFESAGEVK